MPMWFSACINKGPMLSLVISIVFFAAALCLFVFSSSQVRFPKHLPLFMTSELKTLEAHRNINCDRLFCGVVHYVLVRTRYVADS